MFLTLNSNLRLEEHLVNAYILSIFCQNWSIEMIDLGFIIKFLYDTYLITN